MSRSADPSDRGGFNRPGTGTSPATLAAVSGFVRSMEQARLAMRRNAWKLLRRFVLTCAVFLAFIAAIVLVDPPEAVIIALSIVNTFILLGLLVLCLLALGELAGSAARYRSQRRLQRLHERKQRGELSEAELVQAMAPYRNRPLGLLLYLAGAIVFLLVFAGMVSLQTSSGGSMKTAHFKLAAALAMGVSFAFFYIGRQLRSRSAEEALARDKRPPVLYLRSFTADDADKFMHQQLRQFAMGLGFKAARSREEQLVAELGAIGPVVAIGRPGEVLPKLGAARMYVGDDWQKAVSDLAERAALTVLRIGDTEGLQWEVMEVVRRLDPKRVLFCQPVGSAEERQSVYEAFSRRVNPLLVHPLPPFADDVDYVAFDEDWRPIPLKMAASVVERHTGERLGGGGLERVERDERAAARMVGGGLGGRIAQGFFLIVFIIALCMVSVQLAANRIMQDDRYYEQNAWPKLLALLLSALACAAAGVAMYRIPANRWWLMYVPVFILIVVVVSLV